MKLHLNPLQSQAANKIAQFLVLLLLCFSSTPVGWALHKEACSDCLTLHVQSEHTAYLDGCHCLCHGHNEHSSLVLLTHETPVAALPYSRLILPVTCNITLSPDPALEPLVPNNWISTTPSRPPKS